MNKIKSELILNLKNMVGWRTKRKIVIFAVDDYGNVRLDSLEARNKMKQAGLKVSNQFDAYDSLETSLDLELLYEVLGSVKDLNGDHAVFTPFGLPCNIDFEKMANEDFYKYHFEPLPITYQKLADRDPVAYGRAWDLWREGIRDGYMVPQFHGREHLNLKVFEEKLANRDEEVMTALKNRSYSSISQSDYPTISYTAAFDFWELDENKRFESIITDGLDAFERVFGYRSIHFNPPGGREHPLIHKTLNEAGVKFIDAPLIKREHTGKGKYRTVLNHTGKKNSLGQIFIVRNVVFEPTEDRGFDWVQYTLRQIEAAFRWNRPAIISSHRVNFCGHIDPENRQKGLNALESLLNEIVTRWPDAEFMNSKELGALILEKA